MEEERKGVLILLKHFPTSTTQIQDYYSGCGEIGVG